MLPSDISGQGFPYSPRFGGGYGRERTAMLPSDISGQGFPYSPRFGGGYGRERTAILPSGGSGQRFPYSALLRRVRERTNDSFLSDISGQGFPYSPRFCGGYGRERTAVSCPAVSDKASPIPAFRRHLKRRSRARLMPNGNASVRYFWARLPLFPALRRWVWERTNSNASIRRFRTTLPILFASAVGTGENEQQCFRPAVPDKASPTPPSAAGTGENERQFPVRRFRTRLPLLRLRRRVRERTNSNVPVWRFRAGAELKGEKTHEARNLYV